MPRPARLILSAKLSEHVLYPPLTVPSSADVSPYFFTLRRACSKAADDAAKPACRPAERRDAIDSPYSTFLGDFF